MESSILTAMIVIAMIIVILSSLGLGLFRLLTDKGDSKKMVHALTMRIGLSVLLFLGLFFAFYMGWFNPHGIYG